MNENDKIDNSNESKLRWSFCPICGNKIPEVKNIKFCTKCGVDLIYINTHMRMPPRKNTISLDTPTPNTSPPYSFSPPKPLRKKLSQDDLLNLKEEKLWSSFTSIGMTAAAFFLMNFAAFLAIIVLVFFSFSLAAIYDILANPYFIIFSSFIELILFIVPMLYIGKYLKKPNLNNRLILLGFTTKGFSNKRILKEILIGIGFAILGVLLVLGVSFLMEVILTVIFGYEIVYDILGTSGEVDVFITSSDILSIIWLVVIMILIIGTSEEVLFRGFLQKGLVRSLGNTGGILITALIFSSIHLIGIFLLPESLTSFIVGLLLNFFPFFAISLLLGLIYYWRKENLIAVMITHGVYNALTIIIAFLVFNFI
ncbi:MAG: CPBP family intramembrane metalloprotease [Candidatus Lokiarchaeota archaeon]|nr:CPBP family intramembrane metalloprotease [Candidatus Lokiarchaeota archaeon]